MRISHGIAGALFLVSFSLGCGEQATSSTDGGMGGSNQEEEPIGAATSVACESNRECDDGAFCNGTEQCVEGFCHLGVAPECDDGIDCTEDSCSHTSNSCLFVAPDADGDGHADAGCAGPNGESLGDDCDDEDPNRYPGNTESCSEDDPTHDEDCNPNTFGHLDADEDGAVSDACCNASDDGDICGDDCDDSSFRRYPDHPEICDDVDNDCDGEVDVNTKEVLWFPDADGDQYGAIDSEGVLDCSPVDGHALRATDCNDETAAVHSAALEICDGVDNDCDGDIDEGGVCACAPEGNARACACVSGGTGVQSCTGGLWGVCNCDECVSGTAECLGDLLPRTCVEGRWVVQSACTGIRPICLDGACVCSDGSDDCEEIEDIVSPVILATSPTLNANNVPVDSVLAAVFSEDLLGATVSELSVTLQDALGNPIPGVVGFGGSSLTFTPDAPLPPGFDFEWRLEGGIADVAGNTMGGRQTIHFSTAIATAPTPLGDPPATTYDDLELAMSRNGNARIIATRTDIGQSGPPILRGSVDLEWDGSSWIEQGVIFLDAVPPRGLTIDNQGQAIATRRAGSTVFRYDHDGTVWSGESQVSASDDGLIPPLVTGNAVGDAMIVLRGESDMEATIRDSSGNYQPASTPATISPTFLTGDVSESRDAIVVWDQDNTLHAWRTSGLMTGWTPAPVIESTAGLVMEGTAIMGEDGLATVVWVQNLDDGGGPRFDQIQIQDLNASAVWNGAPEFAGEGWKAHHEKNPHVGNDDSGNTHVIFVRNGRDIVWMSRQAGMPWGEEGVINLDHRAGVFDLDLVVSANGVAYAIWIDHEFDNLWGVRFNPGSGWELPQRLEETNIGVSQAQIEVDDSGNAHVIFQAGDWFTLQLSPPDP